MIFANYHTHTTFCDGRDTPEQLVQEAIRLGCPALGFSGHSYTPYEAAWMPKEHILPYQAEIRRLQAVYSGQIRILLGIEQDYYSDEANTSSARCITCAAAANTARSTIRATASSPQ